MSPLPPIQSRHTPRLSGYDYSQSGAYFVTIVTAKRICMFGDINDDTMRYNNYGDIVAEDWLAIPSHFPAVRLDEFIVMPNHVHGIIALEGSAPAVSLSIIIGEFKSGVTRQINMFREIPGAPVWQRSYHDRLIRSEAELTRV